MKTEVNLVKTNYDSRIVEIFEQVKKEVEKSNHPIFEDSLQSALWFATTFIKNEEFVGVTLEVDEDDLYQGLVGIILCKEIFLYELYFKKKTVVVLQYINDANIPTLQDFYHLKREEKDKYKCEHQELDINQAGLLFWGQNQMSEKMNVT